MDEARLRSSMPYKMHLLLATLMTPTVTFGGTEKAKRSKNS